jgi:hypothetical protein
MLRNTLKELLLQAGLKNFDGERIWQLFKDARCSWINNPEELSGYSLLGETERITAPQLLVFSEGQAVCVTGIVDVSSAGLTTLLESQLSYVPRFAIMEWYLTPNGSGFREAIICLGYAGLDEPLSSMDMKVAAMTGRAQASEVHETFKNSPELTKAWCFTTVAALRKRSLLMETPQQENIWNVQLMPVGSYGIQ